MSSCKKRFFPELKKINKKDLKNNRGPSEGLGSSEDSHPVTTDGLYSLVLRQSLNWLVFK
jgi:hypothetical protein